MSNSQKYESKKYQTFEIFDIFQHPEIKVHSQKYCKTMKDLVECADYLQHLLTMNTLDVSDVCLIIKAKHWEGFAHKKDKPQVPSAKLKPTCTCSAYDMLRTKGCVCGHIVPYKPFNPFI